MPRDDEIDLSELFGTISDPEWPIVTIIGVFFLLGIACTLLTTPICQPTSVQA